MKLITYTKSQSRAVSNNSDTRFCKFCQHKVDWKRADTDYLGFNALVKNKENRVRVKGFKKVISLTETERKEFVGKINVFHWALL